MEEKPSQALRHGRRRSSMWRAIEAVKKGEADFAVSAGNTGALMAMARFCLRTTAEIDRPAIAALWPTLRGESVVLDCGATIGADAQQLFDFAVMGGAMARALFDIPRPTVGLLNIGVEEVKGLEPVREAGPAPQGGQPPEHRLCRLRRGRRYRQGHRRCRGDRGLLRQHRAQDRRGHGQADRRLSPLGDEPHASSPGSAISSPATPSSGCARRWIRGAAMAGCSSASTASSSRATAAPTRRVSPRPSNSATAWPATGFSKTSTSDVTRVLPVAGARRRRRGRAGGGAVSTIRSVVLGGGGYLPEKVLTNDELSRMVDTSDEWIRQRTGIRERHIAADGELTSDLGAQGGAGGARRRRADARRHRPDRARHRDARTTPSRPPR